MPTQEILEYYAALDEGRAARLNAIHDLIIECCPDATVSMRYRMPTFERQGNWLAIGNQKRYISVYTCCREMIEGFCEEHPEIKSGKGCLNFRDGDDLYLKDLEQVIHAALG